MEVTMEGAEPSERHQPRKLSGYGLQIAGCACFGFLVWVAYDGASSPYRKFPAFIDIYMLIMVSPLGIWLLWLGRKKLKPPTQNEIANRSENMESDGQEEEGFPWGAFLLLAMSYVGGLVFFGFMILLVYGVAVIVFREAFGVDLPNPLNWF